MRKRLSNRILDRFVTLKIDPASAMFKDGYEKILYKIEEKGVKTEGYVSDKELALFAKHPEIYCYLDCYTVHFISPYGSVTGEVSLRKYINNHKAEK